MIGEAAEGQTSLQKVKGAGHLRRLYEGGKKAAECHRQTNSTIEDLH